MDGADTPLLFTSDGKIFRLERTISRGALDHAIRFFSAQWGVHYHWNPRSLTVLRREAGAGAIWDLSAGQAIAVLDPLFARFESVQQAGTSTRMRFKQMPPAQAVGVSQFAVDHGGNWGVVWRLHDGTTQDRWISIQAGGAAEQRGAWVAVAASVASRREIRQRIASPFGMGWVVLDQQGGVWLDEIPNAALVQDAQKASASHFYESSQLLKAGSAESMAAVDGVLLIQRGHEIFEVNSRGRMISVALSPEILAQTPAAEGLRLGSLSDLKPAGEFLQAPEQAGGEERTPELDRIYRKAREARSRIRQRVKGQEVAIDTLVDAWIEMQVQLLTGGKKLHQVVIFLGVTGAGKTHLANVAAEELFGSRQFLLEEDCTRYSGHVNSSDHHALIGASVGIVGQDKFQGRLPMFLRRLRDSQGRPQPGMILFNEFEKANSHLSRILMEAFDKGVLQSGDGQNDPIGPKLIILTSNKASSEIAPRGSTKEVTEAERADRLARFDTKWVKAKFQEPDPRDLSDQSRVLDPEFVQRVEHASVFFPLSRGEVVPLARAEAESQRVTYARLGLDIYFSDALVESIVDALYTEEDGVRNVINGVRSEFARVRNWIYYHTVRGKVFTADLKGTRVRERRLVIESEPWGDGTVERGELLPIRDPNQMMQVMLDPKQSEKLETFADQVRKRVFGQDEVVNQVTEGIISRILNPSIREPYAAVLLGPSGIGKTELARALAFVEFGSEKRVKRFDMGQVKSVEAFNNIFNPPKGTVGANTLGPFEKAQREHPEGLYFVFDEIGDMGRNDAERANFMTYLLGILEEGEWTSSQGVTYSQKKHRFIFTANDGQEWLQQAPTDDLSEAVWQEKKDYRVIRSYLTKKRLWPESFVGRFEGNVMLMRPVLAKSRRKIAEKLVQQTVGNLLGHYEAATYTTDPDFFSQFGDTFFSHSDGARSIRGVVKTPLNSLFARALMAAQKVGEPERARFHLSMTDNWQGVQRVRGKQVPPRKVELRIQATIPTSGADTVIQEARTDVSDRASKRILLGNDLILRIAAHEAGHVIANDPELTRLRTAFVTIRPAPGSFGGYARYESLDALPMRTRRTLIAQVVMQLGGNYGERFLGLEHSEGWKSDLETARQMVQEGLTAGGLSPSALRYQFRDGKADLADPAVQEDFRQVFQEVEMILESRFKENEARFRALVAALIRELEMTGEQVQETLAKVDRGEVLVKGQLLSNLKCMQALAQKKSK